MKMKICSFVGDQILAPHLKLKYASENERCSKRQTDGEIKKVDLKKVSGFMFKCSETISQAINYR